jgi:hypothetical protein
LVKSGQNCETKPIWNLAHYDLIQADRGQPPQCAQEHWTENECWKASVTLQCSGHGLTAETVLSALEDAEDYKAFEAAIIADYDAQSAVERELVLRLASILWRLRRATTMETGLFDIQAQQLQDYRQNRQLLSNSREVIHTAFRRAESASGDAASLDAVSNIETLSDSGLKGDAVGFARCFLRLANLPNFALDRLSRYEALLWRQAGRILHALEILDRRKTHERRRRAWLGAETHIGCE